MAQVYPDPSPLPFPEPVLRRLPQPLRRIYDKVNIYLDDLEIIEAACKEAEQDADGIVILSGEYSMSSFKALTALGKDTVSELSFRVWKPRIRVSMDDEHVRVSTDEDDKVSLAAFHKITTCLDRCKPRGVSRYLSPAVILGLLMAVVIYEVILVTLGNTTDPLRLAVAMLLAWQIGQGQVWVMRRLGLLNSCRIYLKRRQELPSFWQRLYTADLGLDLVKYIAFFVLGALLTYLVQRFGFPRP